MRSLACPILLALVFITSCAQVPKEMAYPLTYQYKMQASHHWNELARKVAENAKLKIGYEKAQIFMPDVDHSSFGKAMRTFLTTELNHRDLVLTADESSPYKLVCDVQPVYHWAERINGYDGLLATILLDIPQSILLGGTDFGFIKPHSELIVTYELLKNEHSLWRDSEIFYVNSEDMRHYWEISSMPSHSNLGSVKYTMTTDTFEAIKVP